MEKHLFPLQDQAAFPPVPTPPEEGDQGNHAQSEFYLIPQEISEATQKTQHFRKHDRLSINLNISFKYVVINQVHLPVI